MLRDGQGERLIGSPAGLLTHTSGAGVPCATLMEALTPETSTAGQLEVRHELVKLVSGFGEPAFGQNAPACLKSLAGTHGVFPAQLRQELGVHDTVERMLRSEYLPGFDAACEKVEYPSTKRQPK